MRYYSSLTVLLGWLFVASCSSSGKIPCPTYADSQPEKKHKGRPGSQKPEVPKSTKSKSGVLPTDGGGKHMHHTK